jgi:hypothetical protein
MLKTVSEETKLFRMAICNSCEDLVPTVKTCKRCGCFMPAKTTFAGASCPVKRWDKAEPGESLINTIEEKILDTWNKL